MEEKMPLYASMEDTIRQQLTILSKGGRVPVIAIGSLTEQQHLEINKFRESEGLPALISPEILYLGRHHYTSRSKDGYSIEDILNQIISSLQLESVLVKGTHGTTIQNPIKRDDGYGNQVNDRAVLELTSRKPKAELFSVIPKGDQIKPNSINKKAP